MVIVGGARGIGAAVAMTLLAAGTARADDARPGLPNAIHDRFVKDFGRERAEALMEDRTDADRERAAGWLSRWVDANRPGALRPVSPSAVPLDDPAGTR